jgi:deoxyribodipyrimidine photo-lyase
MLWGKRVLTWTREPEEAFDWLVHLNHRWAVDGRDANSAAGIAWCFGRYDRPWPARPIFGAVRTMTSGSTGKKVRAKRYLERWRAEARA